MHLELSEVTQWANTCCQAWKLKLIPGTHTAIAPQTSRHVCTPALQNKCYNNFKVGVMNNLLKI